MKGFTKEIQQIIKSYIKRTAEGGAYIRLDFLPANVLVEVSKLLPKKNFKDRQNNSPTLEVFVKIARKFPNTLFTGYIIGPEREDERFTIDGVKIPLSDVKRVLPIIRKNQLYKADEDYVEGGYRVLWWD